MKKTLVWVLVAANVALAGTLGWRGIASNTANAQVGAAAPAARGKYVLIPGEASSSSSIIYIFDSANGRVGGMAPDARDTLVAMPTIALKPIFEAAAAGQTPANQQRGDHGYGTQPNAPARPAAPRPR